MLRDFCVFAFSGNGHNLPRAIEPGYTGLDGPPPSVPTLGMPTVQLLQSHGEAGLRLLCRENK